MALMVTGCGSSTPSTASSSSATTPAGAAALTASQVVSKLKAHGLPITGVIVYTAATDPNHLLGRPNGYTSKASWSDSRIKGGQTLSAVSGGGSVEVYPTAGGAVARAKYIARIGARASSLNEYDYVSGDELLRLSTVLTPAQAEGYGRVIGARLITAA